MVARKKSLTDKIADGVISNEIDLRRFTETQQASILRTLRKLKTDIKRNLKRLLAGNQTKTAKERQILLTRLLRQTERTIRTSYKNIRKEHGKGIRDLAEVTANATANIVNTSVGASLMSITFTPNQLEVIASKTLIQGAPSSEWWSRQAGALRDRFSDQVRMGVLQGESIPQMAARVENVMDVSRREAEALVRTSVLTINNEVRARMYEDNSDIIKGLEALATLDTRTSAICQARDGGVWDINTGKALPKSPVTEPFPGPPPWHWNCRTVLIPITKSFEELGLITKREVPKSVRASMTGDVSETLNYDQWLRLQTEEIQIEALGPSKWEIWKEGDLTLAQMLDQTGRPLTLKELREKAGMET